jgi:hypothetical protein
MRSPMPVRCGLMVQKGLKVWSICCEGIPTPASPTDTGTLPVSDRSNSIATSRVLSVFLIASIQWVIRFMATCCNSMRSALTWGRSAASSVKTDMSFCVALPRRAKERLFSSDLVYMHEFPLRCTLLEELAHPFGDVRCMLCVVCGVDGRRSRILEVWRVVR